MLRRYKSGDAMAGANSGALRATSAIVPWLSDASSSALRAASLSRVQSFAGAVPSFGAGLYSESL